MPVFHGQFDSMNEGFHIVAVNMKNRTFCDLANIGTVCAASGIKVIGGKTYLVIDHYMNCTTCTVTIQIHHLYYFIYDTLTGNGSITMYKNRSKLCKVLVVFMFNARSCNSLNYR